MPRPRVTLSYAQSLDGSLAAFSGRPLALSGPESLAFTHQLRSEHDAILIGIGTVLADNPRLTVRLVPGPDPQPIVLDTHLRFPLTAHLLQHPRGVIIIATTDQADSRRQAELESAGVRVVRFPRDDSRSNGVHLPALLDWLGENGLNSLMVEGGSRVITSFLQAQLVNRIAITIAPCFVGGLHALTASCEASLRNVMYRTSGADLIVEADIVS